MALQRVRHDLVTEQQQKGQWGNPPANAGDSRDAVSLPGLGRSPGEGNG